MRRLDAPAMFTDWLIEYGLWSVVFLMLLQNLIPLLPSEVIMPLAGFLASLGYLDLRGAMFAGLAGSLLGHMPWYAVGRMAGRERLLRYASRYGRWMGLGEAGAAKADLWFRRNAGRAVLLGRLVPGIRTCVNIPAGASRMPLLPFLGYTALGDALWTGALAWGGYVLGREYHVVSLYVHLLAFPALAAGLLAVAWYMRRRRGRSAALPSSGLAQGIGPRLPPRRRIPAPGLAGPAGRRLPWRLRFPGIPKGA